MQKEKGVGRQIPSLERQRLNDTLYSVFNNDEVRAQARGLGALTLQNSLIPAVASSRAVRELAAASNMTGEDISKMLASDPTNQPVVGRLSFMKVYPVDTESEGGRNPNNGSARVKNILSDMGFSLAEIETAVRISVVVKMELDPPYLPNSLEDKFAAHGVTTGFRTSSPIPLEAGWLLPNDDNIEETIDLIDSKVLDPLRKAVPTIWYSRAYLGGYESGVIVSRPASLAVQ